MNPSALSVIERFKQDRAASDIPAPLSTFLHIYLHANHECYINYMEGAKALARYLAPIDIPIANSTIPRMLHSYELTELAKAILPHTVANKYISIRQVETAIYEYLTESR